SEEGATRGELAAQEAALARVEAVLKELRSEAQGSKQVALDLFQSEAAQRADCARARERLANLGERRQAAGTALAALAERLEALAAEERALAAESGRADLAVFESEARQAALEETGRALESEGGARGETESALRA